MFFGDGHGEREGGGVSLGVVQEAASLEGLSLGPDLPVAEDQHADQPQLQQHDQHVHHHL